MHPLMLLIMFSNNAESARSWDALDACSEKCRVQHGECLEEAYAGFWGTIRYYTGGETDASDECDDEYMACDRSCWDRYAP